ncbi:MAG TPA: stage III sporulation protein AD [Candidatus Onthoplasma faecigallinarum]|nr:stage III sporulation protein AD [Candidatus Onthoplasma faecigallinarum]
MVELLKILAVAIVTVFAHMLVKQTKPEIAMIISIAGSVLIIVMAVDALNSVISSFYQIFETTGVDTTLLTPLFKIIAIGYITEFGANICLDAGASSVADKVLFAGKLIILLVALPIVTTVIDMVVALL